MMSAWAKLEKYSHVQAIVWDRAETFLQRCCMDALSYINIKM